jgi:hypothetical protein
MPLTNGSGFEQDPAIFIVDLQDANKKLTKKSFLVIMVLFEGTFTFGSDLDRNRVTWETLQQWSNSHRQNPIGVRASYTNHAQMQVWSEQMWLNTTFILRGSRSWDKLEVET